VILDTEFLKILERKWQLLHPHNNCEQIFSVTKTSISVQMIDEHLTVLLRTAEATYTPNTGKFISNYPAISVALIW
jgi:hypothetical protein